MNSFITNLILYFIYHSYSNQIPRISIYFVWNENGITRNEKIESPKWVSINYSLLLLLLPCNIHLLRQFDWFNCFSIWLVAGYKIPRYSSTECNTLVIVWGNTVISILIYSIQYNYSFLILVILVDDNYVTDVYLLMKM